MRKGKSNSHPALEITSISAISHVLENRPQRILRLVLSEGRRPSERLSRLYELARRNNVRVETGLRNKGSEAVRATLSPYEYSDLESVIEKSASKARSTVLALDHVQDPQNLGAVCRTAEAFAVDAVMIPKDRGVGVSSGVYQASVGAVETLSVVRAVNLGASLKSLKDAGYWVVGACAEPGSRVLSEMPDFEKTVVVLGAEWEGLGKRMTDLCDCLVRISIAGKVESLNVSAAATLFIYELWRRGQNQGSQDQDN